MTMRGQLLAVDDNRVNRIKLARLIELLGHDVTLVEDGEKALELLKSRPFDLLLLDIVMPGMDGYEVLRRLRLDGALRTLPVIVISAIDNLKSVVKCIEMGAEDYLPKPFDPVLLRARIDACLEKKRLRDHEQEYLQQLQIERERSERLLLNILPQPIAERLKHGQHVIADSFPEVTVLFEFWPHGLRQAGRDPREVFEVQAELGCTGHTLSDAGELLPLDPERLLAELEGEQFTSVVWTRAVAAR